MLIVMMMLMMINVVMVAIVQMIMTNMMTMPMRLAPCSNDSILDEYTERRPWHNNNRMPWQYVEIYGT